MPEEEKKEPQSGLVNLVDSVYGSSSKEEGSSGAILPVALILLGLVVIGFAILGIMLVMSRRKAAKLASQVRKLEEEKAQAQEDITLAQNDAERHEKARRIEEMKTRISELEKEIEGLQEANKKRVAEINKITDWNDFIVVDRRGAS